MSDSRLTNISLSAGDAAGLTGPAADTDYTDTLAIDPRLKTKTLYGGANVFGIGNIARFAAAFAGARVRDAM